MPYQVFGVEVGRRLGDQDVEPLGHRAVGVLHLGDLAEQVRLTVVLLARATSLARSFIASRSSSVKPPVVVLVVVFVVVVMVVFLSGIVSMA